MVLMAWYFVPRYFGAVYFTVVLSTTVKYTAPKYHGINTMVILWYFSSRADIWNSLPADLRTPDTTLMLLQASSSQGPPVSAVVYAAAGRWAQHRSSGAVVTSEFDHSVPFTKLFRLNLLTV